MSYPNTALETQDLHPSCGHVIADHEFQSVDPQRVYSLNWRESLFVFGIGLVVWLVQEQFGLFPNLWISFFGVFCYLFGATLDFVATYITFVWFKRAYDRRGIEFPVYESNGYLPLHPTLRDQIFNSRTLLFWLILPLVAVMPGVGMAMGIIHAEAVFDHVRNYPEMRRQLAEHDRKKA